MFSLLTLHILFLHLFTFTIFNFIILYYLHILTLFNSVFFFYTSSHQSPILPQHCIHFFGLSFVISLILCARFFPHIFGPSELLDWHSTLTAPLVFHHTRIYKCAMKKITYNGQMRNEHFLIVIYRSSLVKAAVNGLRICKLRSGVKKRHNFFFFQWSKVDQVRSEYSPQLSKLMA
jgi:hypothetical protein